MGSCSDDQTRPLKPLSSQSRNRHADMAMEYAGLDPAEMISQLRAAHAEDETKMGVDVVSGHAGDMQKLGIFESFKVTMFKPFLASGPDLTFHAVIMQSKHGLSGMCMSTVCFSGLTNDIRSFGSRAARRLVCQGSGSRQLPVEQICMTCFHKPFSWNAHAVIILAMAVLTCHECCLHPSACLWASQE